MPYFYILFSASLNKFYIGSTHGSLEARLNKHFSNHKGFTAKAKDWSIVYQEFYQNYNDALRREKIVKSWKSKNKILQLIQQQ